MKWDKLEWYCDDGNIWWKGYLAGKVYGDFTPMSDDEDDQIEQLKILNKQQQHTLEILHRELLRTS